MELRLEQIRAIQFLKKLETHGMKPATIQEIIDNKNFAQLIAHAANDMHAYLGKVKEDETFELVAEKPVTLKTPLSYLFDYVISRHMLMAGYRTVENALLARSSEIMSIHQIGKRRADHIRHKLTEAGFEPIGDDEPFWSAVDRIYGSIEDAPALLLIDGGVVYDSPYNVKLLAYHRDSERLIIGDLRNWSRRQLAKIKGDPNKGGRRTIEPFLIEHGVREAREPRFVLLEP